MSKSSSVLFGSYLREKRERRGLTLREIADSTKISMTVLRAIEDDRYDDVPGGIFARAFVKSYAVEVGLDPCEAVEQFFEAFGKDGSSARLHVIDPETRSAAASPSRFALWLAVAGMAVIVAFVITGLRMGGSSDTDDVQPVAGLPEDVLASTRQPLAANAHAAGVLRIEIHPTGPCWVSLTVDGKRVFSRVLQPGERKVHVAEEEFVIVVGDAAAFEFSLNDQDGQLPDGARQATVTINRDNYESYMVP